ncbi:hypothetical protein AK812_SmicGene14348 [Symbiodinium microadriaticum]|uniref:Uncharacterized protein n=1 Tax=Symbiodinium microadriaticum TaxID=2951 RepID=A0A1Q9E5Q9_SYMMI|nr:hypothetical protein AK812_SmicGene14348 [Symbiodinium microadriaticum]
MNIITTLSITNIFTMTMITRTSVSVVIIITSIIFNSITKIKNTILIVTVTITIISIGGMKTPSLRGQSRARSGDWGLPIVSIVVTPKKNYNGDYRYGLLNLQPKPFDRGCHMDSYQSFYDP